MASSRDIARRLETARAGEAAVLAPGVRVRVEKGCMPRGVPKGAIAYVKAVEQLGAEYSHAVRVALYFPNLSDAGRSLNFYVRHQNRLADRIVGMNDGNPSHRIELRRA